MASSSGIRTRSSRFIGSALAVSLAVTGLALAGAPTMATATPATTAAVSHAATSATAPAGTEAKKLSTFATPKLAWYACYRGRECATVKVPRDYDHPHGAKTEIALLRVKAQDPKHRVGTLFVNPGGPGGSGVQFARYADQYLAPTLLQHFDIVGFDPRGTNYSDNVKCFANTAKQKAAVKPINKLAFPMSATQTTNYVAAAKALGKACSNRGEPLSASMSTAEVARDMDVLRRAVHDKKLSYLGFSYGTYLGQVYANMFPKRVRALAIDGVIDPIAWAGTAKTAAQPQSDRLHSADGASKALHELLVRCDRAGGQLCDFATGDPVANFADLAKRLRSHTLVINDPYGGEEIHFSYADMIGYLLDDLYSPYGYEDISYLLSDLMLLTEPPADHPSAKAVAHRRSAMKSFSKLLSAKAAEQAANAKSYGFPYHNDLDAYASVMCTDSRNPARASDWSAAAVAADQRAPYFGRIWAWASAPCATKTWTAHDEDVYRGPFTRKTSSPMLVVGNTWDPATNYQSAVKVAGLLPNSRLLSSKSWGHTAYGTSACVTNAVDSYLVKLSLPKKGKTCTGDVQPYAGGSVKFAKGLDRSIAGVGGGRPVPVVPILPLH